MQRKSGRKATNYEIRYRREGFNISVSSNDLESAKAKFVYALIEAEELRQEEFQRIMDEEKELKRVARLKEVGAPDTFHEFAMYYFEKYRSRKVSALTLENDSSFLGVSILFWVLKQAKSLLKTADLPKGANLVDNFKWLCYNMTEGNKKPPK